ncbi:flagellar hook capping FlgD N-terminal domain-containing protein [Isoptericola sp. b490]|uniref:flagellar hook assembly protein FlgD n=1 Tax=Actinotalea lenta TaxID=3064654 RepID=UPI002713120B|nr:flagellar hook capping FlgD N-terminal domain-containing protein [Isoptericola sp. b490]MDO8122164.1 flagellar hook capping FlgD N-terminal domain-containing protein [Isoptericola sp. b490]
MIDGATAATSASTSLYAGSTPAAAPKTQMDQQSFLTLLVAQLKNQDPSSPLDTNEMMAQSTQLASMEQLTALADTTRESFALQMRIAATGLVGQQVSYADSDGVTHTDVASGVSFAGKTPMVTVGDATVPLDSVRSIGTVAPESTSGSSSSGSSDTQTSTPAA